MTSGKEEPRTLFQMKMSETGNAVRPLSRTIPDAPLCKTRDWIAFRCFPHSERVYGVQNGCKTRSTWLANRERRHPSNSLQSPLLSGRSHGAERRVCWDESDVRMPLHDLKRVESCRDGFHTVPMSPPYMKWVRIYPSSRYCPYPTAYTRQKRVHQRADGIQESLPR